ncbi:MULTISPECIES: hypothetical protein [Rhizobium]|uniref:hypothetical protein n=1 Tax=Rhizobium TaxID=379 RepID=UPI00103F7369|nr:MULTISPECIES: hypothetical protein [Rhizobium]MBB3522806.1 ABC-type protease/lipase transport system fused ATPase/permease subunit [Rhizobium sp. BK456]MBY4589644.1 hypothetical protein [Rhizobium redzepovicii]MBY4613871.1 hypothetical protein [Rhizobium redzepovicii]MDF0658573.1 hypothetical protein [Rhizobium sp. BC49]TBY49577.1 hypothetical protein E0H54_07740 [Rhizobium leguminosarum bv. viciae]
MELTKPIFMVEVCDQAMLSKSVPALIAPILLATGLLMEVIRSHVMLRMAAVVDGALTKHAFAVISDDISRRTAKARDLKLLPVHAGFHSQDGSNGPPLFPEANQRPRRARVSGRPTSFLFHI